MDKPIRAYSYRRFSSATQAQGDSLRRQKDLAKEYCLAHGLELDTSLSLNDLGVSAFKGANVTKGALGSFIKAIDEGIVKKGSYLLVENLDRISRQEVDVALEFFLSITRKGIIIVTLDDGTVYSKQSIRESWTKLVIALAAMAGAHEQSAIKSRRIGLAWEQKRANLATRRLTKMCPGWLRPTEDGWEVVEEKAQGVRRIYELNAEGYGKSSIAKILNTENVPSLSGAGWHANTVQKLLMTRTVIGEFQAYTGRHPNRVPAGDPVPNYYPKIIDDDLWLRAQRPKKSSGGKGYKEMVNVFRGLLRCPTCGGLITTYTSTRENVQHRALGCYNHRRGLCKVRARWKYSEFLEMFLHFVAEVDLNSLLVNADALKSARLQIIQLQQEIDKLTVGIENLALSIADDPSPALNKLIRDLERERNEKADELKKAEETLGSHSMTAGAIQKGLSEAVSNLEKPEFRLKLNTLLRQLIDRIEIYLAGTGIKFDGVEQSGTQRGFSVFFRNGAVRVAKEGFTMKFELAKSG